MCSVILRIIIGRFVGVMFELSGFSYIRSERQIQGRIKTIIIKSRVD